MKHAYDVKFSDRIEVVELVQQAYSILGWDLPSLGNTLFSTSLPRNLVPFGKDNLKERAKADQRFKWVSTGPTGQTWDLKVVEGSIKGSGKYAYGMVFVNQDHTHVNKHYEAYNDGGFYLGIADKDTMLPYAEAIPYEDRNALPKNKSRA